MATKERLVKCRLTGEYGSPTKYFKAPNGYYFRSESAYEMWLNSGRKKNAQKKAVDRTLKGYSTPKKPGRTPESYAKLCDTIADLIGYERGGVQPMPTIVFRRLKELEFYTDEIIQQTFDENMDAIQWALKNKTFNGDVAKASYIMAIVRNNIGDVYRRSNQEKESHAREEPECLNMDMMFDLKNTGAVHKSNDLSGLLGGGDLWI